jgi:hypothetical protein
MAVENKLLKTGKTYELGRKDKPLVIKHARISKDHAGFQVAGCTEDNIVGSCLVLSVNVFTDVSQILHLNLNYDT